MRISVTRVSAGLVLLALLMAASLHWSLARLEEPYQLNERYYSLQSQISVQTRQSINRYLETGDAMRLLEAEQLVRHASGELNHLPEPVAEAAAPLLTQLLDNLSGDFSAAGKLAGDPQGLLINSEREFGDGLAEVADYARDGYARNTRLAFEYAGRAQKLAGELRQLSHARQRYFANHNSRFKTALNDRIRRMQLLVEELNALPRLGLMTRVDPDALVAEAATERMDGIAAELRSLLSRYPDELIRTHTQITRGNASKDKVQELVAALDNALNDGSHAIRQRQDQITRSITVGGILLVLCLLLAALALPSLRRSA